MLQLDLEYFYNAFFLKYSVFNVVQCCQQYFVITDSVWAHVRPWLDCRNFRSPIATQDILEQHNIVNDEKTDSCIVLEMSMHNDPNINEQQ